MIDLYSYLSDLIDDQPQHQMSYELQNRFNHAFWLRMASHAFGTFDISMSIQLKKELNDDND